jgi:hypothetical protein
MKCSIENLRGKISDECSTNNQHHALIFTTPLFYILALTCFGSSMPSSGSFLDPSELLEIQIEWVVYQIMCDYVPCVPAYPTKPEYQRHLQMQSQYSLI